MKSAKRNNALSDTQRQTRNLTPIIIAALSILVTAAYCRVFGNGFTTLDDPSYVTKNPHVMDGLTRQGIVWAFTHYHSANWHPLTWISHMADAQLFGMSAGWHHAVSLLFHLVNTALVFVVMRRMTGSVWRSALVAALFGVHPVHVESVAWVAERKDVLSTLFWLLTMLAYTSYARRPSIGRYVPVLALYALGLMAKPMLVSLPLVLIALDWWPLGRYDRRGVSPSPQPSPARGEGEGMGSSGRGEGERACSSGGREEEGGSLRLVDKAPLFALAAASCVVTVIVQRAGGAVRSEETFPIGVRVANAAVSYVGYIAKMIWPAKLAALYPHPGASIPVWQTVICAALLIAATCAAACAGRKRPYVAVGWLWYLVTLVPVIGLVQVGNQAMADRYTYVPSIGLFIIVAWGAAEVLERVGLRRRTAAAALAGLVLAVLSTLTFVQVGSWRDGVTLMEHALAVTNGHPMAHYCLADALHDDAKPRAAVAHYEAALAKDPKLAEALSGIGRIRLEQRRVREAEEMFRRALKVDPKQASAHNNLGQILAARGRTDDAIRELRTAIRLDPSSAEAEYNLGSMLDRQGGSEAAMNHYRRAVRIGPELAEAHCALGSALARRGDAEGAEDELREAIRLKPSLAEAHFGLAAVVGQQGDMSEAVTELRKCVRIRPKWGLAHYSLSVAYSRMGDYSAALKEAQAALKHGSTVDPAYLKEVETRAGSSAR